MKIKSSQTLVSNALEEVKTISADEANELYGIEGSHSYELPGKYQVTLTVMAPSGNTASSQTEITVNFDGFIISYNLLDYWAIFFASSFVI